MKASTTAEQPTPESLLESQPSNGSEDKAAKMRNALSQGTLGLGFSAGGFLYCYHLGNIPTQTCTHLQTHQLQTTQLSYAAAATAAEAEACHQCIVSVRRLLLVQVFCGSWPA
jgi:hypothetical protein